MIIRANKILLWLITLLFLVLSLPIAIISECSSVKQEEIVLPIIMYHHVTTDPKKAGKYTVLQSEFKSDLEYIKSQGYTTVTPTQLYDAINTGRHIPDKIIMITFDDGFESFYKLSYTTLKNMGMNAVLSVIGIQSEKYSDINDHNINYSNLNWDTIREISMDGYVETGNHTFDLHHNEQGERKGMSKKENENESEYEKVIFQDINKMQLLLKQRSAIDCKTIAYPYGLYNSTVTKIIKNMGFICSLTCEEKINIIQNCDDLYNLGRYNRPSGVSSENFLRKILNEAEKYQVGTAEPCSTDLLMCFSDSIFYCLKISPHKRNIANS